MCYKKDIRNLPAHVLLSLKATSQVSPSPYLYRKTPVFGRREKSLKAGLLIYSKKDRQVALSPDLLPLLRHYWKLYGLQSWLFPGPRVTVPVHNSANLAMFMVNLSHALIRPLRPKWPGLSVNDLKTWFRSRKYVVETLKLLPETPEVIFIDQIVAQVAELGRINHMKTAN